jgi:chromatin structure-remodeling complex protein RSC7
MQPTHARVEQVNSLNEDNESTSHVFPPLPPIVARNFLVTDIHLETPPIGISPASYGRPFRPGTAFGGDDFLTSFRGLEAVPHDIKALLPEECRTAFDQALDNEKQWHGKWGNEVDNTCRRPPIVDKAIVPYSMAQ